MSLIFFLTAFVIMIYFMYPLWLKLISAKSKTGTSDGKIIEEVTLVLLSYNGKQYLEKKIRRLKQELEIFPQHEMIIIDDKSDDGSQDLLKDYLDIPGIKIILKEERKGIPHSMNLAVSLAAYENIIFCDQRQVTSRNSLVSLVEPLGQENIGAVSACISHIDKAGCTSWIRRYENFLKENESRAGSLMGVYGPLYAIKKNSYAPIPEHIILDDLYLSLNVLSNRKIYITRECIIYDEHLCTLHDYRRIRRYLRGFQQILADRTLLRHLPLQPLTMLIWHKYIRLLIPVLLCLCYFTTGILSFYNPLYLLPFAFLTIIGIASLTPFFFQKKNILIHFVRINMLYVIAMMQLVLQLPDKSYKLLNG